MTGIAVHRIRLQSDIALQIVPRMRRAQRPTDIAARAVRHIPRPTAREMRRVLRIRQRTGLGMQRVARMHRLVKAGMRHAARMHRPTDIAIRVVRPAIPAMPQIAIAGMAQVLTGARTQALVPGRTRGILLQGNPGKRRCAVVKAVFQMAINRAMQRCAAGNNGRRKQALGTAGTPKLQVRAKVATTGVRVPPFKTTASVQLAGVGRLSSFRSWAEGGRSTRRVVRAFRPISWISRCGARSSCSASWPCSSLRS